MSKRPRCASVLWRSSLAQSIGVSVSETMAEITMVTARVTANS